MSKECPFCDAIIAKAAAFAKKAHLGQERKFIKQPYFAHPERVAHQVSLHPFHTGEMVAASYLHDVVEDCGVTLSTIRVEFGDQIADLVAWLTNPSKGSKAPRAERKWIDRQHIKAAPREAKIIKIADRLDNLMGLCDKDGVFLAPLDFMELYVAESKLLLTALAENEKTVPNCVGIPVGQISQDFLYIALRGQIDMLEDNLRIFKKEVANLGEEIKRKHANTL